MLYKCYISFLNFFHELYNKNNYFGVKKLFHHNLSILSVFFFFFLMRNFKFFSKVS